MSFIKENLKAIFVMVGVLICLFTLTSVYKNYQTRAELKDTIIKQGGTIEAVDNSNRGLKDSIALKEKVDKVSEEISERSSDKHRAEIIGSKKTNAKVEQKVQDIKDTINKDIKSSKSPEDTAVLAIQKDKAISSTRINGLWDNYCKAEPSAPECGAKK